MIDITNDNISEYILMNGADKLMTSVAEGFHILVLTKKNKLIGKCFSKAQRSKDKLSVESIGDIVFLPNINAKANKVLLLTADGKFSLEWIVIQGFSYFHAKTFVFVFNSLNLYANKPTIIKKITLSFPR